MPKYLLVARDAGDWSKLAGAASPAEIQAIIDKYRAWSEKVAAQGKLLTGEKLRDGEGRVLKGQGKATRITDGPHSESKEIIGGFWILQAANYEEAVKLASDSPHLQFGSLELRAIEEMQ
ncbi:MAG: YciI family protein [Longimicrobiales bacterium]